MLRRRGAICQCSNGRLLLMNNIAAAFVEQLPAQRKQAARPPLPSVSRLLTPGDNRWPVTSGSPGLLPGLSAITKAPEGAGSPQRVVLLTLSGHVPRWGCSLGQGAIAFAGDAESCS